MRNNPGNAFDLYLDACAREYLRAALAFNGWNVRKTAAFLGMHRASLYNRMKQHNLTERLRCVNHGNAEYRALEGKH